MRTNLFRAEHNPRSDILQIVRKPDNKMNYLLYIIVIICHNILMCILNNIEASEHLTHYKHIIFKGSIIPISNTTNNNHPAIMMHMIEKVEYIFILLYTKAAT